METKKIVFLVDFDNTMFDNVRYKEEAFFPTLSRASGITVDEIKQLYKQFLAEKKYFDISEFVVILSKRQKETVKDEPISALHIRDEVLKINTAPFLNRDAGKSLKTLQELGNVAIYSQGDFMIQSAKIARSGILKDFSEVGKKPILSQMPDILTREYLSGLIDSVSNNKAMVIIDNKKAEHVGELTKTLTRNFETWLIDDRPDVLENARSVAKETNLVFVKYGPYAETMPRIDQLRTVDRFDWKAAMSIVLDNRRGIPPVKLS